jgi:hypothetical protein
MGNPRMHPFIDWFKDPKNRDVIGQRVASHSILVVAGVLLSGIVWAVYAVWEGRIPPSIIFLGAIFIAYVAVGIWRWLASTGRGALRIIQTNHGPVAIWPNANLSELSSGAIREKTVSICEVPHDPEKPCVITGKIFDRCILVGPAVLHLLPSTKITGDQFAHPEFIWIKERPHVGAITLDGCEIKECHFVNVGFCGSREEILELNRKYREAGAA